MITGYDPVSGPYGSLLRANGCIGCHASTVAGTWQGVGDAPIVFNTSAPTYGANGLAAGNFYYVVNNENRGHNVTDITNYDTVFNGKYIPGSTTTYGASVQVTCAGEIGCHGDRTSGNDELAGISGAHHTDDSGGITGGSVGLSYRFLNGILGTEDSDWEQDDTNTSHNEYKGGSGFPATETISSLCGQCHGDFHSSAGVGSTSPWLRHPTDKVLNSSGEYASYTTYSMTAPVARPTPGVSSNTVTPGTDIIMCLSCHRAHGSPNYKMIRWDNQANMEGCVVCHTSKN